MSDKRSVLSDGDEGPEEPSVPSDEAPESGTRPAKPNTFAGERCGEVRDGKLCGTILSRHNRIGKKICQPCYERIMRECIRKGREPPRDLFRSDVQKKPHGRRPAVPREDPPKLPATDDA